MWGTNHKRCIMKLTLVVLMLLAGTCYSQTNQAAVSSKGSAAAKPLLLEKYEGERRVWRDSPPGDFTLKVSPKNNGSKHLVMGTEDFLPGDSIPKHQHLGQDEIVFVQSGTVHVQVGGQERYLHSGGMAFIPSYAWASLKNESSEPASIVFVFSAPGFEEHMRCASARVDENRKPMTSDEQKRCDEVGNVVYQK